jgi:hypothetical protein
MYLQFWGIPAGEGVQQMPMFAGAGSFLVEEHFTYI